MDRKRVYCTYFDSTYLPRGKVMLDSLRHVGETGPVLVLALDDDSHDRLDDLNLLNVKVVSLEQIEATFPQLLIAKTNRSRIEYVFTLTPWISLYARSLWPDAEWVTYLDADLGFFSSCQPIYDAMQGASVGIIPHRFHPKNAWRSIFGTYNVGWVSFRNDPEGSNCLQWWANSCVDWCFDRPEGGKFADQGYLDSFSRVAPSTALIQHPGANVAPWNLASHDLSLDASSVLVDGERMIFFHFHGIRNSQRRYFMKHFPYRVRTTQIVRESIYRPYCTDLALASSENTPTGTLKRCIALGGGSTEWRNFVLNFIAWVRRDFVDV